MASWKRDGVRMSCQDCGATFPVGGEITCSCDADALPTVVVGDDYDDDDEPLLTERGQRLRLADLANKVRVASDTLDVKKVEAELKIIRCLMDATDRRGDRQKLDDIEHRLAKLDSVLAQAQGSAGRADRVPTPPMDTEGLS